MKWINLILNSIIRSCLWFRDQLRKERAWKMSKKEPQFSAEAYVHQQLFLNMARPQFMYEASWRGSSFLHWRER